PPPVPRSTSTTIGRAARPTRSSPPSQTETWTPPPAGAPQRSSGPSQCSATVGESLSGDSPQPTSTTSWRTGAPTTPAPQPPSPRSPSTSPPYHPRSPSTAPSPNPPTPESPGRPPFTSATTRERSTSPARTGAPDEHVYPPPSYRAHAPWQAAP